jgi:hypothetical protein
MARSEPVPLQAALRRRIAAPGPAIGWSTGAASKIAVRDREQDGTSSHRLEWTKDRGGDVSQTRPSDCDGRRPDRRVNLLCQPPGANESIRRSLCVSRACPAGMVRSAFAVPGRRILHFFRDHLGTNSRMQAWGAGEGASSRTGRPRGERYKLAHQMQRP